MEERPPRIGEGPREAAAIALRLGVCPKCGAELTETRRYGSGSLADGIFCSLSCMSTYHYGLE